MKEAVVSAFIWIGIALSVLLLWLFSFIGVILTGLWDKDRRLIHAVARAWAWSVVRMNPFWNLTVENHAHLDPRQTYVVVANHQSFADVALLPFIQIPYKCFSKSELFKLPFFGWSLALHRHIKIKRGSIHGIYEAMKDARDWLKRGMTVAFFVEGTRSRVEGLQPFKIGAFKLAIENGLPIAPLVMSGTREAWPRGTWKFNHKVYGKLILLPPVPTRGLKEEDAEALRDRIFGEMQKTFEASAV